MSHFVRLASPVPFVQRREIPNVWSTYEVHSWTMPYFFSYVSKAKSKPKAKIILLHGLLWGYLQIGMNPAFYPNCVGLFICTPHMIEHCEVPSKMSAIPWFSFIEDFCVGRIWILHCFHSLILNMFSFKISTPLLNPLKKVKKLKTLAIIGSALYFLCSVMLVWKRQKNVMFSAGEVSMELNGRCIPGVLLLLVHLSSHAL